MYPSLRKGIILSRTRGSIGVVDCTKHAQTYYLPFLPWTKNTEWVKINKWNLQQMLTFAQWNCIRMIPAYLSRLGGHQRNCFWYWSCLSCGSCAPRLNAHKSAPKAPMSLLPIVTFEKLAASLRSTLGSRQADERLRNIGLHRLITWSAASRRVAYTCQLANKLP